MGWARTDQRRRQIVALVGEGHNRDAIAAALGVSTAIVVEALASAGTNFREVAKARRAEHTARMVYRGVALPVAASLQGLALITAQRDLDHHTRLSIVRGMLDDGASKADLYDFARGWVRTRGGRCDRFERLRLDLAVLAVLDGTAGL